MVSDKLQFTFLCELYKILRNREYNKRDKRLRFGIFRAGDLPLTSARGFCQRLELSISNFRQYGVGASIQVELASPKYDGVEDTIDLVLSFNLKEKNLTKEERVGYWPKCAMAWTQHQANMNKECFNNIMTHGASVICKGPDPPILSGETLFRLSFSYGEAQLFDFATVAQREAFKMLKIIQKNCWNNLTIHTFQM